MRPLSKKLARLQRALKADIRWGRAHGLRFDPNFGAARDATGKWIPQMPGCYICAVGMAAVRRQPPGSYLISRAVAALFRVPEKVVHQVFVGVQAEYSAAERQKTVGGRIAARVLAYAGY